MSDKPHQSRDAAATPTEMANAIRMLAVDAVEKANSGHPGMPMGMADLATVLFTRFLKFDPADPAWPDRDRFVVSNGHGSMLLYALLYLTGYPDIDIEEIKRFRQLGSKTAGHPEYGHAAGIETTTGPLGQGIANAVGMALTERMLAARYGDALVDHHTYVFVGDGCLMEGIGQEAISLAGNLRLSKLIALYDSNDISIDGPTSLSYADDAAARFEACGWDTRTIDGHDHEAIAAAIEEARRTDKPSLIVCRTTIGYGAPTKAGTAGSHGAALGPDEVAGTRKALNWPHAPFHIPAEILAAWRGAGAHGGSSRAAWQARLDKTGADQRRAFEQQVAGALPAALDTTITDFKRRLSEEKPGWATRVASQKTLEVVNPVLPAMIGGSADLTGSNNTKTASLAPIAAQDFSGRYIYYGVREHGMAAVMNGMALHKGFIPYGGTFMVFTDYCRPSIRLSALMGLRVIYVMTHDSIGLGEDGPTHQPVEHLASLRAMPNLNVLRPADAVETAECWQIAIEAVARPSVLALTRQGVPTLRTEHAAENRAARGGYVLREAEGGAPRVVLLATGSEVSLAVKARDTLQAEGIPTRVVSLPCWALFDEQDASYRAQVLGGDDVVRVSVEAATTFGWANYVGPKGASIGIDGFGASAPAEELYTHFGITTEEVVKAAKARL